MSPIRSVLSALVLAAAAAVACADDAPGVRFGEPTVSTWRFGVVVKATSGPVSGIVATMPVPMDWPEQTVKVVSEEKSPNVARVSERVLDGGVKQLVVSIPRLAAGQEASFVRTVEIAKRPLLEPTDASQYVAPAKSSRELAKFLLPSPYIESNSPKIKQLAGQVTAGKAPDWERAAAAFDWVRENVKYEFAEQIKPALDALEDGQGDCEELSSLVIALCRASKIPARAVWVPGHCYPEFYLVDRDGKGRWFPCQAAGEERQFGSMVEERPILQKGDNFKVPEERGAQRYVKQSLTAKDAAAPPEVRFILEPVSKDGERGASAP